MTERQATQLVKEYLESGLGQREFCRRHDINRSTLRYWIDRIKDHELGKEVRFCEVVVGGDDSC